MPPTGQGQNSLKGLLGEQGRKAHEQHIKDPLPSGDLPEGIRGGVAQLKTISIQKYESGDNAGKPYVRFGYVATFPEHVDSGEKVAGRQFSEMFNMFGRPGKTFGRNYVSVEDTLQNRYASLLDRLKISFGINEAVSFDQIDQVLAALQSKKPLVRFSTGKATDAGRVFANVGKAYAAENGQVESTDAGAGVEDQTGDAGENQTAVPDTADYDAMSLDELLEVATGDDEEAGQAARNRILDIADEHGIKDDVEGAESWQAGVELIQQAQSAEAPADEPAPEPEPDWQPKKGATCLYQPKGKDGKPIKDKAGKVIKASEHEIATCSEKGKWVTLKNSTTGKAVIGPDKLPAKIAWADIKAPS